MWNRLLEMIGVRERPTHLYRFPLIRPEGGNAGHVDIRSTDELSAIIASRLAVDAGSVLIGPPQIVK